jgi:hypothetical protein
MFDRRYFRGVWREKAANSPEILNMRNWDLPAAYPGSDLATLISFIPSQLDVFVSKEHVTIFLSIVPFPLFAIIELEKHFLHIG